MTQRLRITLDNRLTALVVVCALLSGCASFDSDYYCVERAQERCKAWEFGPSKAQKARFDRGAK